jgi:hypothetical protein
MIVRDLSNSFFLLRVLLFLIMESMKIYCEHWDVGPFLEDNGRPVK